MFEYMSNMVKAPASTPNTTKNVLFNKKGLGPTKAVLWEKTLTV